ELAQLRGSHFHPLDEPLLHALDVGGVLDSLVAPSEPERLELARRPQEEEIASTFDHFVFRSRPFDPLVPAIHVGSLRIAHLVCCRYLATRCGMGQSDGAGSACRTPPTCGVSSWPIV